MPWRVHGDSLEDYPAWTYKAADFDSSRRHQLCTPGIYVNFRSYITIGSYQVVRRQINDYSLVYVTYLGGRYLSLDMRTRYNYVD